MKYLTDEHLAEYRNGLLTAEKGIEQTLQQLSLLELGEQSQVELCRDLNKAYALIETGLHKEHLLRDWGDGR